MTISASNLIGMNAATISKLFAPIPDSGASASNTSAVMPSVSSAGSSASVTSAAIAAIQALVKGGTASASANADAATQDSQSLPDWYTATGTTTFTPLNSTKSVTMPTDAYDWYKATGQAQTLDDVKAQFYKTETTDNLNTLINEAQARGDQTSAALYTSLEKAMQNGTVKFQLLDPSVSYQNTGSVIRDGSGHITGMSAGFTMDWDAYHKVYNDSSLNYMVGGGSVFMGGNVISWPKN